MCDVHFIFLRRFGAKAALLVGYEEVRPVTKRLVTSELSPAAGGTLRQTHTRTVTRGERRLFPVRNVTRCCSIFWKWLFPLLVFLLLLRAFGISNTGEDGVIVSTAKLPFKILRDLFNIGRSMAEKTMESGPKLDSLLFGIPRMLYSAGESVIVNFLEIFSILGHSIYGILRQFATIPEWLLSRSMAEKTMESSPKLDSLLFGIPRMLYSAGSSMYRQLYEDGKGMISVVFALPHSLQRIAHYILGSLADIIASAWGLAQAVGQLMLALPSYFISKTYEYRPFAHRAESDVKWDIGGGGQHSPEQAELSLDRLRREKELLETKMSQLRRERELEENRYKDIHEAIRLVGETASQVPSVTDERLLKSAVVNEELLQHKIEKDFQNYVANLKKTEDAELSKVRTPLFTSPSKR
ncbi:unnamed protein product [Gongylonema pulchrum]|uniref:Uncharacterized protein n=1 Tax=Gongylonema pulchrum TaxID=637853 RepID=A0A183DZ32_9BILA|nr:unnamed protein product [Gongylonema pulchrum]